MANSATKYMRLVVEHKRLVGENMRRVATAWFQRAVEHDNSKFGDGEFAEYARQQPMYSKARYGTPEYEACMQAIKPAIEHHYQANSHHPEHFPNGVNDMNLLDVLEMVCDWMAAAKRVPGDTLKLDAMRQRFNIDEQLFSIIQHTVEYLED